MEEIHGRKGGIRKMPANAIGLSSEGRPIIPKFGESPEHARKRVEARKRYRQY